MKPILLITILIVFFSCTSRVKKEYYINGKIKTLTQIDEFGRKDGKTTTFYETGEIESQLFYSKDKMSDTNKWYYKNAIVKSRKYFLNDVEEGDSYEYDTKGIVIKNAKYTGGKLLQVKEFTGNIIKEYKRFYTREYFDTITLGDIYRIEFGLIMSDISKCDSITYLYKKPKLIKNGFVALDKNYELIKSNNSFGYFEFLPNEVGTYGFYIAVLEGFNENKSIYMYKNDFVVVGNHLKCNKVSYTEGLVQGKKLMLGGICNAAE